MSSPLKTLARLLLGGLFTASAALASGPAITALPDHPNGIYREGETIHWKIRCEGVTPPPDSLNYAIKKGGLTPMGEGKLNLVNGEADLEAELREPGTLLVELKAPTGSLHGAAGAVVAPEQIKPGAPAPADFENFWAAKLAELKAVPIGPVVTPAASNREGVNYEKIKLNNIQGTHVYGQLAYPVKAGKFPALLQLQYAGLYPLQQAWVTDNAAGGWLAFNIIAHDLPIDQPESFYKELNDGKLRNYPLIGSDSRETSYFLRMFLGCRRAAEYLASRPEWNGTVFVVVGGSQGGLQSFVTAAFEPRITAVIAEVPAGCDPSASAAGRAFGWPYWGALHSDQAMATSRYYDAAAFATHVTCPLLVSVGLIDVTSPAGCVWAAFNQARGPKEIFSMPQGTHQTGHTAFFKRRDAWLGALAAGQAPPVQR